MDIRNSSLGLRFVPQNYPAFKKTSQTELAPRRVDLTLFFDGMAIATEPPAS
jgi:hypothetical protein